MRNLYRTRIFSFVFVFLSLFYALTAFAVVVPGLYQATVPVNGGGLSAQNQAATVALPQVLVKVSGNANVAQVPGVAAQIANASNFVQQFALIQSTATSSTTPNITSTNATPSTQQQLKVQFDPRAINQLLQQLKQPIWSDNRPLAMIWLSVDHGSGPTLIGSSSADDLLATITTAAAQRGLPVILPVLDLQDLTAVNVSAVVNNSVGIIQAASSRYNSDVEVIGRITTTGNNQWQGAWSLVFNDQSNQEVDWTTNAASPEQLVTGLVNDVTNNLAAHYANAPTKAKSLTKVRMLITNVSGLSSYANLMDYLNGLGPVKQAQVTQVNGSRVEVELLVDGDVNALTQAIALDNKLVSVASPDQTVGQPSTTPVQAQPQPQTPAPTQPSSTVQQAGQIFTKAKNSVKNMIKPSTASSTTMPTPTPTVMELYYQWAG